MVVLAPPGEAVTVYEVTGEPLSTKEGFQPTYARSAPPDAAICVGAIGAEPWLKVSPRTDR